MLETLYKAKYLGQAMLGLTHGKVYDVSLNVGSGYLYFDNDDGMKVKVVASNFAPVEEAPLTGGSSSYYDVVLDVLDEDMDRYIPVKVSCIELIETLNLDWNEANMFKAIWRSAAARQGNGKRDHKELYDAEKIVFYGERKLNRIRKTNESD